MLINLIWEKFFRLSFIAQTAVLLNTGMIIFACNAMMFELIHGAPLPKATSTDSEFSAALFVTVWMAANLVAIFEKP